MLNLWWHDLAPQPSMCMDNRACIIPCGRACFKVNLKSFLEFSFVQILTVICMLLIFFLNSRTSCQLTLISSLMHTLLPHSQTHTHANAHTRRKKCVNTHIQRHYHWGPKGNRNIFLSHIVFPATATHILTGTRTHMCTHTQTTMDLTKTTRRNNEVWCKMNAHVWETNTHVHILTCSILFLNVFRCCEWCWIQYFSSPTENQNLFHTLLKVHFSPSGCREGLELSIGASVPTLGIKIKMSYHLYI